MATDIPVGEMLMDRLNKRRASRLPREASNDVACGALVNLGILPRYADLVTRTSVVSPSMAEQLAVLVKRPVEGQAEGENIYVENVPVPPVEQKQVLVKLWLRPIHPAETCMRVDTRSFTESMQRVLNYMMFADVASTALRYPGFNKRKVFPAVPGMEGVGFVHDCGPGSSKFQRGQRVVSLSFGAINGSGTWQQFVAVAEDSLTPVPDSLEDTSAAQAMGNPVTCLGFMEVLKIPKGSWLLQTAANSELGLMMASLCKHRGIKSINIVRRKEAEQDILHAGGDAVIAAGEGEDFTAKVKEITDGELAWAAIDAVAGSMTGKLATCVRPGGQVLVFGALGGITVKEIGLRDLLFRGISVGGFWLTRWIASLSPQDSQRVVAESMHLLETGILKPRTGKIFELSQVKEAIAASLLSGKEGKVFLRG